MTNDSITTAPKSDVEIEVVICQKIVRQRREYLMRQRVLWRWWDVERSQFHRREVGIVDLGDLDE